MTAKIFINYRRDDSSPTAGRLRDRLAEAFGEENVFFDIESIPAGVDFVEYLAHQVATYNVFLVLIGPEWLISKDEKGCRRIDSPDDPVAVEIAAALKLNNTRVVPVTIDGASLPRPDELPSCIKSLVRRNGVDVRNAHFRNDVDALIAKIRPKSSWSWRTPKAVAALIFAVVVSWLGFQQVYWAQREPIPRDLRSSSSPHESAPEEPAPQKPAPLETAPQVTAPPKPAPQKPAPKGTAGRGTQGSFRQEPDQGRAEKERPIRKFTTRINRDIYGYDIPPGGKGERVKDIDACAERCDRAKSCVAFSLDRWNKNLCFLKSSASIALLNPHSIIGVKKPRELPNTAGVKADIRIVLNHRFPPERNELKASVRVSNLKACEQKCANDKGCVAFSFLKLNKNTENCDMFSEAREEYLDDPSADSGWKQQFP